MQAASDPFLGWSTEGNRHYYVRHFRDMKGSMNIEKLDAAGLMEYSGLCGAILASNVQRGCGCIRDFSAAIFFITVSALRVSREKSFFSRISRLIRLPPMPTALTPDLNQSSMFVVSMPPVGINKRSGKTPRTDRTNAGPRTCAGKILTSFKPAACAPASSVGEKQPGIQRMFSFWAKLASWGTKPGLTRKSTPSRTHSAAVFESFTVPIPRRRSGNSFCAVFFRALKFLKACRPRLVNSTTRTPDKYRDSITPVQVASSG